MKRELRLKIIVHKRAAANPFSVVTAIMETVSIFNSSLLDENYNIDINGLQNMSVTSRKQKEEERKTYESIMKRVNTNKQSAK